MYQNLSSLNFSYFSSNNALKFISSVLYLILVSELLFNNYYVLFINYLVFETLYSDYLLDIIPDFNGNVGFINYYIYKISSSSLISTFSLLP